MTTPTGQVNMTGGSGSALDPSNWQSFINQLPSTSNQTTQPKVNPQGQLDIFGIGQNSGVEFPVGTQNAIASVDPMDMGNGLITQNANNHNGIQTTTPDEYLTMLMHLSQTDPNRYLAFQQGLYNAGFYGRVNPGDVGFGRYNQATKDALVGPKGALTDYLDMYKSGATQDVFGQWLQKQVAAAQQDPNSPGNVASAKPPGPSLTDPSISAMFGDQQAEIELGHALNSSQQAGLLGAVQGQETSNFQSGQGGGSSYRMPEAIARQWVAQNNLPEYTGHQALGVMLALLQGLGGKNVPQTKMGDVAVGGQ